MSSNLHWYYLHTNGSLIHKTYINQDQSTDFMESNFVRKYWLIDITDRESAWTLLLEALSLGALVDRIRSLAIMWNCNGEDLTLYLVNVKPSPEKTKQVYLYLEKILEVNPDDYLNWLGSTETGKEPNWQTMPRKNTIPV